MIIYEKPDLAVALLQETYDRLSAAHVSGGNAAGSVKELTQCLVAAHGMRWRGWVRPDLRDEIIGLIRVHAGTGFGDLLNPDPEERIEIKTKHGIISGRIDIQQQVGGTIDYGQGNLFSWGLAATIPGEIKLTWKSPRKNIYDFVQYVEQIMGYMVAKNETTGRLYVLHITSYEKNGAPQPKFRAFELVMTQSELREFELELERRLGIVLDEGNIPSTSMHPDGECDYCPFHKSKGGECEGGKGYMTPFIKIDKFITED